MKNAEWQTFDFQYLQQFKITILFTHFITSQSKDLNFIYFLEKYDYHTINRFWFTG